MATIVPSPRAIPTTYRNTQFRSRLEARWAATFDHLGWYWEYEPAAIDFGDGFRYLCDFWLPFQRCWVEVKGPVSTRLDKTNHLRKRSPRSHLVIIARPAGPERAVNFHSPTGYAGVSIQRCTACGEHCFHDYMAARAAGDDGWTCRNCHRPDALQRTDSYLPAVIREQLSPQYLEAFWPTTSGLLLLANPKVRRAAS